ncbi:MAG TPA: tripartite tricarboxylate transporter substrate-binding protein [Xanthobacteraceae bacterium]|jgi:tripartite-type tricarboxylate transporter receptor subunit TctC|nr:tripartite tricarboxylate transporter substrate-binding protein [Xanthobacteraceae bacterium]
MKAYDRLRGAMLSAAVLIGGAMLVPSAAAQEWPARNITVVVPLGAGSASDVIARVVMDQVAKQLGATIVVENRPGAGGTIGANMVAKSPPDGYTILAYGAMASANALYKKLPFDALNDFIPVIALGQQPLVVIAPPARGWKTLGDLIAAAKAKPDALNYSSAGVGSASHFGAERIRASAGFEAQHIPFKGAAEAVTEVVAGRIDFSVQLFATTISLLRDNQLVALAVSSDNRTSVMPQVPTTIEAGLPASSVYPFYSALYVPANTPRDIVAKLERETAAALRAPAVQAQFAQLGVEPMAMNQEQFTKFFRNDVAANLELVKIAKIPTQ